MSDPLPKIILRLIRQTIFWPLEALLVFILFGTARILPVAIASVFMGLVMSILGPLTPWHKRARRNLVYAMPHLSYAQQNRILRGMWMNLGRVIGEYPHINKLIDKGYVEFIGQEHIRDVETGGFLISAHMSNWELGPFAARSVGKKVAAIYRPLNNPFLSGLLARRQRTFGGEMFPKGREAALGMISAIRKNQFMCLLIDQKLREGMAVPFFGHPANTPIGHIKVAIKKNVPIFYVQMVRVSGCHFRLTISPAIDLPDHDDDDSVLIAATAINKTIEDWIIQHPEQWFWPHRRWTKDV